MWCYFVFYLVWRSHYNRWYVTIFLVRRAWIKWVFVLNCDVLGFGYCPRTLFHIIYEPLQNIPEWCNACRPDWRGFFCFVVSFIHIFINVIFVYKAITEKQLKRSSFIYSMCVLLKQDLNHKGSDFMQTICVYVWHSMKRTWLVFWTYLSQTGPFCLEGDRGERRGLY